MLVAVAYGTESSGRAIIARQRQGDTSNYHFFDNMAKSMRHACRIIVSTDAEGMTIAFLHPKSTQGILTELCENKNK